MAPIGTMLQSMRRSACVCKPFSSLRRRAVQTACSWRGTQQRSRRQISLRSG